MANQYRRFEINGLNQNQARIAMEFIQGLDQTGVSTMLFEYTPVAGNPEIPQNTLRISIGGPDLSTFLSNARTEIQARFGRLPDIDVSRVSDLDAIQAAYQTHGASLANRPALKAALVDIWRNGARCMSGEDKRTLDQWLINRGFKKTVKGVVRVDWQAFKNWLNQS